MSRERSYWLAWAQVPGIKPQILQKITANFPSLAAAWQSPLADIQAAIGRRGNLIEAIAKTRTQLNPEAFLEQHQRRNPHFWTPADPEYPRLLLENTDIPPVIYYRGTAKLTENQGSTPLVAIVGTRKPTPHGCQWAKRLSRCLAKCGLGIVAGMSPGIDAAAHQACLEVKGRAIAVFGTGVDVIYPRQHSQLYEQILETGLILSEYPADTQPDRNHFPARNRLIAALCRAVIIIEAPERSGALITARHANDLGRDVYILPNSPDVKEARGCLRLLSEGANPIIDEQELLLQLGAIPELDSPPLESESPLNNLNPELQGILKAVKAQNTPFDLIVAESKQDAATVAAALLELELLGLVKQLPGMQYQLSGS